MSVCVSSTASPLLAVFDLDHCLYFPEMYLLSKVPQITDAVRGKLGKLDQEGVIGVKSANETISLFPGALSVLQDIYAGKHPGLRIAAASSADTPLACAIGRAALGILEVVPGVTVRDVFALGWPEGFDGNMQIGRSPPLSDHKEQTHFPILQRNCGIGYRDMLFFDDCNWGDNVGACERALGVIGVRTPHGLQER
jgi:magnesium-dependent phosphatase 1